MKTPRRLLVLACALLWTTSAAATGELGAPTIIEESTAPAGEKVARAILTSKIVDREPVDELESLTSDRTQIYFFTELHGLEGSRVTHRWEYQGKTMGEVHLSIQGPRWRIWSSKTLEPSWVGHWKVSVLSEDGQVLASKSFVYAEK
jgi:hypothetical protein